MHVKTVFKERLENSKMSTKAPKNELKTSQENPHFLSSWKVGYLYPPITKNMSTVSRESIRKDFN